MRQVTASSSGISNSQRSPILRVFLTRAIIYGRSHSWGDPYEEILIMGTPKRHPNVGKPHIGCVKGLLISSQTLYPKPQTRSLNFCKQLAFALEGEVAPAPESCGPETSQTFPMSHRLTMGFRVEGSRFGV